MLDACPCREAKYPRFFKTLGSVASHFEGFFDGLGLGDKLGIEGRGDDIAAFFRGFKHQDHFAVGNRETGCFGLECLNSISFLFTHCDARDVCRAAALQMLS